LEQLEQLQQFEHTDGYYYLPRQEKIVVERQRRVMLVEEKMRIAVRGIKKLRWVPFVRAVFVCNTLAMGSVSKDSDIDVLIITDKGRIWLARFLCNTALKLFGLSTGKRGIKNKICLSFFIDEEHLNLADLRINSPDVYLIYWLILLMPIYDPGDIRKEIIKKNAWAVNLISRGFAEYRMLSKYRVEDNRASRIFKKIWEKIWRTAYGNFLESQARIVQMAKLKMRRLENKADKSVMFNESIIKLHENDRRWEYQERWQRAVEEN